MRFFFDTRYIRTDFHDGVSRYTTELAIALQKLSPEVTFIISNSDQKRFLPKDARTIMIHPIESWKEPFSSLILNRYHPDIVATPLQTMGSFGRRFKLILNQQDMTYYRHTQPPRHLGWHVRLLWRLYHMSYIPGRWTLNSADMVATVSETSKQEILHAKLTKRPVIVIPDAARDLSECLNTSVRQLSTPPKNLVYMGAFLPYKNVETLIAMMEYLPGRTLHLLSRISDERRHELELLIPHSAQVKFYNGVSDEEYAELLADNAILVNASKSEGYGLPVAEALKLGVPAVITDMPVFHEVGGKGAVYADPASPHSFATAVQSLDSIASRKMLIKEGVSHSKKFTWQKSAQNLLKATRSLVEDTAD